MTDSTRTAPRVGVVFLVPDRWRGIWTLRHHVAHRLGRHFEVVWVEAARPWRQCWGLEQPRAPMNPDAPTDFPGLTVYDPGRWLPEIYKPRFMRDFIRRARIRAALHILKSKGCSRFILYLWRPEFDWALEDSDTHLACYHIDDEYTFTVSEQPIDPTEQSLMQRVDQVFIHSKKLLEKKGGINPHTSHVPNGVDYAAYSTPTPEPRDLGSIERPRMGYVGVVKAQLDFDLLRTLARGNPQWQFVMVGPQGFLGDQAVLLNEMSALPNFHLLGNRAVQTLPAYVQGMDACMMPYTINDYTNAIYPLKLHEYLAAGRPTVASPIHSVLPFRDVVSLATTPAEWQAALAAALDPSANRPELARTRRERAAEHDWELLVGRIATHLRSRLESVLAA